MTIYTLYVKTHKVTEMKYLGQTTKNAHTYRGSGIDWKKHLLENGNDVRTEILYSGYDREEMKRLGRHYSKLWDVVNNPKWANRIPETGGGSTPDEQTRKLLSERNKGKKKPLRTDEHKKKLSQVAKGKSKTRSLSHQLALTDSIKANWANNSERKLKTASIGKANKGRKHSQETLEKRRQGLLKYWRTKKSQAS